MSIVEEVEKLNSLKESGAISEEEYEQAKASLLSSYRSTGEKVKDAVDGMSSDEKMWGMFIHLSQFCGYVLPLAGLLVPIILWQIKKNESEIIDRHGRIVVNWIITALIVGFVGALLCVIIIGFPLLLALSVASIAFPIIGGVKANNGEVWKYPCSITFFSLDDAPRTE